VGVTANSHCRKLTVHVGLIPGKTHELIIIIIIIAKHVTFA